MIPPSASLQIDPSNAFRAFREWAAMQQIRGKNHQEILRKLMKFWISFAMAKIPEGDAETIRSGLLRKIPTQYSRNNQMKGALAATYRNTIAAALVAMINYKGVKNASNLKTKNKVVGDGVMFYRKVAQFVARRVFSRNLHKAGFRPALSALRAAPPSGVRLPRYKNMPGSYKETAKEWSASLIAENFASSAKRPGNSREPLGIAGLAPNALSDAEDDMAKLLERWLAADLEAAAAKVGFFAKPRAAA